MDVGVGGSEAIAISCCDTSAPTPSACVLSPPRPNLPSALPPLPEQSQKIPLPWDFTATELCRSCGKPHTELYELFENIITVGSGSDGDADDDVDVDEGEGTTSADGRNKGDDGGGGDVGGAVESGTNNEAERDPNRERRASTSGSAHASTATNHQQQNSKMDNILQEMQIWELRIKPNDGLPQRICPKCTAQFYIIGKFRRKCLKVQMRLRALYEERRLEEQLMQRLDDKENLNIPPVLDIGNDLINDNYGQPLSEVELFETNWNTQATHNEPLSHELLVNDTEKCVGADNDNVDDELPSTGENVSAAKSPDDCPPLVLEQSLGTTIDLAIKANIDEESLLDTQAMFKSSPTESAMVEVTADKATTTSEKAMQNDTDSVVSIMSEERSDENATNKDMECSADDLKNNYYEKDSLSVFITNRSEGVSVSENTLHVTNDSVEIISIENLNNIELVAAPSSSNSQNSTSNALLTDRISVESVKLEDDIQIETINVKELSSENSKVNETSDKGSESKIGLEEETVRISPDERIQPCKQPVISVENEGANTISTSSESNNNSNNMSGVDLNLESTTDNDVNVNNDINELEDIPLALRIQSIQNRGVFRRVNDKITFVTKASLKEYDSSVSSRPEVKHVSSNVKEVRKHSNKDPNVHVTSKEVSDKETTNTITENTCRNMLSELTSDNRSNVRSFSTAETTETAVVAVNETPTGTIIKPYAQKRRKKSKRTPKPASFNQIDMIDNYNEVRSTNSKLLTRDCSVRLCKLSDRTILKLLCEKPIVSDMTVGNGGNESESSCPNELKRKLVQDDDDVTNEDQTKADETSITTKPTEDTIEKKRPKISSEEGEQTTNLSVSPWKTKAEMKSNMAMLGLRNTRRKVKLHKGIGYVNAKRGRRRKRRMSESVNRPLAEETFTKESVPEEETADLMPTVKDSRISITTISADKEAKTDSESEKPIRRRPRRLGKINYRTLMKLRQRKVGVVKTRERKPRVSSKGVMFTDGTAPAFNDGEDSTIEPSVKSLGVGHESHRVCVAKGLENLAFSQTKDLHKEPTPTKPANEKCPQSTLIEDVSIPESRQMDEVREVSQTCDEIAADLNVDTTIDHTEELNTKSEHDSISSEHDIDSSKASENHQTRDEKGDLIVRVPLAALTEEFQRLHFTSNVVNHNNSEVEDSQDPSTVSAAEIVKMNNASSLVGSENEANDYPCTNFCKSAAVGSSVSAGAHINSDRAPDLNDTHAQDQNSAGSNIDSDHSEFYGFATESDHPSLEIPNSPYEKSSTTISSQITDYINDFQTNCLDDSDTNDKSDSYSPDESVVNITTSSDLNTDQSSSLNQIETARDSNVTDKDVENTINGILNEMHDQHIFSSSTTLVTMESEDFHSHSTYSPMSEQGDQTPTQHTEYIRKSLCDLAESGPTANQNEVEGNNSRPEIRSTPHNVYNNDFSNYVECFTEDSTQSELIGFQNDIPCFENIELSSSTPRHNISPSPQPTSMPTANSMRTTNSALQGAIQHTKNVEFTMKNGEGNVQYLGLTNEPDMSSSMTDTMGLVCTTGNGIQMHTPSLTVSGQSPMDTFGETPSPEGTKEYAVDSATLHFTQIFTDLHHPPHAVTEVLNGPSTSRGRGRPRSSKSTQANSNTSTNNSVLSKFSGGSTGKRPILPKKDDPNTNTMDSNPKMQYLPVPNVTHGNTQLSSNIPQQLAPPMEAVNIGPNKLNLYTEVLPQNIPWQTTGQEQQTTYYINTNDLQQSNLISTTTISMSNALVGNDGRHMPNISLLPASQLPHHPTPAPHQANDNEKRSVDANENYIEGMQNQQPIMIVFPQEYMKESPSPTVYSSTSANEVTITPIPPVLSASTPQRSNTTTTTTPTSSGMTVSVVNLPSHNVATPISSHQEKVNLTCRFCHKRPKFTNNLDYSNHIIATHPVENPYNCPHCSMFFIRRVQRQQHIMEAHGTHRFQCAQCGERFSAQRALDLHLQRSHVPDSAPQQQQQQQQQRPQLQVTDASVQQQQQQPSGQPNFIHATSTWHDNSNSSQVRVEDVHLQVADDEKFKKTNPDNTHMTTDIIQVNKPPHRILGCPDCDDSFDDLANQEPHAHQMPPHAPVTMPSPEQTEPDSTSTTTLRQFRKQRSTTKLSDEMPERILRSSHSCVFCDEKFTNDIALRKHHQMAHGNQSNLPFVCSMCKRGFRMRTALQRHMETHDSEGRPYECNFCYVRFPRPSQLTLHKLTVHFLDKPHACKVCGKHFGTESALKTHEKFHGDRKVNCDECNKKFFLVKDLRRHRRIHTGERFYKCDICPRSFVHYTRLCAHIKTHIPLGMYIEEDPPSLNREPKEEMPVSSLASHHHDSNVRNPQNSL